MIDKGKFIEEMKSRTKKLSIDVIKFCDSLVKKKASEVVTYQIVKSAMSTGANYRAACKARSRAEFFSKMSIVVEEADETVYWLEVIKEAELSNQVKILEKLLGEATEISKIVSKARSSTYKGN